MLYLSLESANKLMIEKGFMIQNFPLLALIHANPQSTSNPYSTNFWLNAFNDAEEDYDDDGNKTVVSKIMVGRYAISIYMCENINVRKY